MHISQRLLQATKAGRSPGNDGTFNPTVSKYFTGRLGRSESLYLCSLKVHSFKNFSPRVARRNYFIFFSAALRAVQHGLHTSNLPPTPMMCSGLTTFKMPAPPLGYDVI